MKRVALLLLVLSAFVSAPALAAASSAEQRANRLNSQLENFSRMLAGAMANPETRALVREEAAVRFDGDTEFLYRTVADRLVGQGVTLHETLRGMAVAAGFVSAEAFDRFVARQPRLQIAIPGLAGVWDAATYSPEVTYWPVGVADTAVLELRAFGVSGRSLRLDAKSVPSQPILVVGLNQRTDANGDLRPEYDRRRVQECGPDVFFCDDGGGGGGGGGGTQGTCTAGATHAYGDMESLFSMTVTNDHEPSWKGDPEIMVRFVNPVTGIWGNTINLPNVNQENQLYTLDQTLFTWTSPSSSGFTFEIWEDDYGLAGVIDGDDFVGSTYVRFTDGNCSLYPAGDASVTMKFK